MSDKEQLRGIEIRSDANTKLTINNKVCDEWIDYTEAFIGQNEMDAIEALSMLMNYVATQMAIQDVTYDSGGMQGAVMASAIFGEMYRNARTAIAEGSIAICNPIRKPN